MWATCFFGSIGIVLLAVIYAITVGKTQFALKKKSSLRSRKFLQNTVIYVLSGLMFLTLSQRNKALSSITL